MKKIIMLLVMMVVIFSDNSEAYLPEKTHPLINDKAVELSTVDNYLKSQLGFNDGKLEFINGKNVVQWLQKGGTDEDDPSARGAMHFHDPTKDWSNAGIFGLFYSSLQWAQNHSAPTTVGTCTDLGPLGITCPEPLPDSNPYWSWPAARTNYYDALTSADSTTRGEKFANTFLVLGHVMHLLADAAVPEHARNDQHLMLMEEIS